MSGTITITSPASDFDDHPVTSVGSGGEAVTTLEGSKTGPALLKAYGRVYEDSEWTMTTDDVPPKPWAWHDANSVAATEGWISGTQFTVDSVPVSNFVDKKKYTAFAWGDFHGERCYAITKRHFVGRTAGTDGFTALTRSAQSLLGKQLTPSQYELHLHLPPGSKLPKQSSGEETRVQLTRRADTSSGPALRWSSRTPNTKTAWELSLSPWGTGARAVLRLCHNGRTPVSWQCSDWDFLGPNRMTCSHRNSDSGLPEFVIVEPSANNGDSRLAPLLGSEPLLRDAAAPLRPYRFVTALNDKYVPGFLALVRSMQRNSGIPFRFVVLLYDDLSRENYDRIERLDVPVEFFHKDVLGPFRFDRSLSQTPRLRPNFDKILIWKLPFDETMCYVDSDMLCLSSLSGIDQLQPLSVAVKQSVFLHPTAADSARSRTYPWNSGFMVFRPDRSLFDDIQRFAESYRDPIPFGDQVILVDYFAARHPEMLRYVNVNWNMSTWVSVRIPQLFRTDRIRFLHFAQDAKPWKDDPSADWMRPLWKLWERYGDGSADPAPERTVTTTALQLA